MKIVTYYEYINSWFEKQDELWQFGKKVGKVKDLKQ